MKKFSFLMTIIIVSNNLFAQLTLSADNISHLFSNTHAISGWNVIGNNPANLAKTDQKFTMNIGMLPLVSIPGVEIGNSAYSLSLLHNNFFTGQLLTEKNKDNLLSAIPNYGLDGYFRVHQNIAKFSIQNWALGFGLSSFGTADLPASLIEFGLHGNKFDDAILLDGIDAEVLTFSSISINYGNQITYRPLLKYIEKLYWGVGLDILVGAGYENILNMQGDITTQKDGFQASGSGKAKAGVGGLGYSVDLGLTAKITGKIDAALSLQNVINQISWGGFGFGIIDGDDTQIAEFSYAIDLSSHDFLNENLDSLLDAGINKDTTYGIGKFKSKLPGSYNISGGYQLSEKIKLNAALYGFFSNQYGFNEMPRFSLALDYWPKQWWPVTVGLGTVRHNTFIWSLGTGLSFKTYHLNLGLAQYGGFFNYSRGFLFNMEQSFYF